MKKLFEGLSGDDLIQKMNEVCHHKTVDTFDKPLSHDEIQAVKDIVTDRAGKIQHLDEEKKAFMESHNSEMKPLKAEFEEKVKEARTGTRKTEGEVWFIDDQEEGVMTLFDEQGNEISSRPLRRDERDASVFKMAANS